MEGKKKKIFKNTFFLFTRNKVKKNPTDTNERKKNVRYSKIVEFFNFTKKFKHH